MALRAAVASGLRLARASRSASHLRSLSVLALPRTGATRPLAMRSPAPLLSRSMFIQTKDTPNPNSLMFLPGCDVLPTGTREFDSTEGARESPLARQLLRLDGVKSVFFASDYVSIVKDDDMSWSLLKPHVFAVLMDFFSSNQPVLIESAASSDTTPGEEDDDIVLQIKELLDTRIRPAVQEDGGDILYMGFENGIVKLKLQGACTSCPSSEVTLRHGVEQMLMHYIVEVDGVEQVEDTELDRINNEVLDRMEQNMAKKEE
eukprot:m.294482 g.294482  ORF g.294482 m.294482 type:complete len:261 (-) comp13001_c0_seq1:891-1673(-)